MTVIAIVLGVIGAVTGLCALYFSARSVKAAEKSAGASELSARAAIWANASALTPEVEVALRGEVPGRWKFIFANTALRPMGNLPVLAQQEETYGSPAYDHLTVACAARLRVKNKGDRLVHVTIHASSLAFDDPFFSQMAGAIEPTLETRTALPDNNFELLAGQERNLIVYAGRTIKQWLDAGLLAESEEFDVLIDISAGPDAAALHWRLTMKAKLVDSVYGQGLIARIVPAVPPEVSLVELPRTVGGASQP